MRRIAIACAAFLLAVLTLLRPEPSTASDGTIEINAAKAAAGGVTPGDTQGLPVTLSLPGSYRLTGNLSFADPDTNAIEISASEVTLDLGGFGISGCASLPCPAGAGIGVVSSADGVTVKNGRVSRMGADGIALQSRARVEDVDVTGNAGSGITALQGSVRRVSSTGNGGYGVILGAGLLEDSELSGNGAYGASLGNATSYARNVFSGNSLSVSGGHATGGNVCSDKLCSVSGAQRFYLTTAGVNGANALTACTSGFHMASLWEILEPSPLMYEPVLGFSGSDAGSGPPAGGDFPGLLINGWVRTGASASAFNTNPGLVNCSQWTSGTSGSGTVVSLQSVWDTTANPSWPWSPGTAACSSTRRVWCVED